MKKIQTQLLTAMSSLLILSFGLSVIVSYQSARLSFVQYVSDRDIDQAKRIAGDLSDFIEDGGKWEDIGDELESKILRGSRLDLDLVGRERSAHSDEMDSEYPLVIIDAGGKPVYFGFTAPNGQLPDFRPRELSDGIAIEVEGETRAYIFFKSMITPSYNEREQEFLTSLATSYGISALAGFFLSVLFATYLSRRLVRPILELDTAVKMLGSGESGVRVTNDRRDELGSLSRNFNVMADHLDLMEQARQNLLGDIAHELRTPLSIIKANLEMMIDGVYQPDEARLRQLLGETEILASLVSGLRSINDLESGAEREVSIPIDVAEMLHEAADGYASLLGDKPIPKVVIAKGLPILQGQRGNIMRVLRNLIDNARAYGGGQVEVSAATITFESAPSVLRISVKDQGPGVPESELEKIFQRFYRVDASRNRASGGYGLGLSICKIIMESHGGRISAENRPGGGLAVHCDFPNNTK